MRCLVKFIFLSAMAMALANSLLAEPTKDSPVPGNAEPASFRKPGVSRFLAPKMRFPLFTTCNKYPRICRAKGSPGPDCCHKMCVNVAKDRFNCGKCGNMCKFTEICCKGKCVNPWTNEKHCGGCNKKCKKGSKCMFGMCSYA